MGAFGIGRDDAEFRSGQRAPVSKVDLAPITAAPDHHAAGVLLRSHDPVGILAVSGYVVYLRHVLGVPHAPGVAAIEGDRCALVGAEHHTLAVGGVDPLLVVVFAAGRTLVGLEGDAAVGGFVHGGADGVNNVGVLRIHEDAAAIGALAVADAGVFARHVLPGRARVVRAVQARAVFDVVADDIHALAIGVHGNGHCNAARKRRNLDFIPGLALVGGFEELCRFGLGTRAAVGAGETASSALSSGQQNARVVKGVFHIACAVVVGGLQSDRPGLAAIGGAVDTAAFAGGIAECGDNHEVRIRGVNKDAGDLHGVFQADVLPGAAGISGLPHAVAEAAADGVAGAGINDIGI